MTTHKGIAHKGITISAKQLEQYRKMDWEAKERDYKRKRGLVPGTITDIHGVEHPIELMPLPQRKARSLGKHYRTSSETSLQMAKYPIPARTRQVLDYMLARSYYQNLVDIRQSEIAEGLGIERSNVARAIAWLLKKHYIAVPPEFGETWKPGKPKKYLLNPYRFAKGHDRDNALLQKENPELNIPITDTPTAIKPNPKIPTS